MISSELAGIEQLVVHKVGNKNSDEGVRISKAGLRIDDHIKELLLKYFMSPFKQDEYYNLYHESEISQNAVYRFVSAIFNDPEQFHEQSVNLAKHLYEHSTHPKIKSGEFYVVYFNNCILDGESLDAVGIFKSESKETYLRVYPSGESFEINSEDGININKLDKGCLIFNSEPDSGYLVAIVDKLSKGNDARFWKDDFLHILQRKDDYYNTQNVVSLCKDFVTEKMPEQFEVSKADQADILNKSAKYLKEKDSFGVDDFAEEVLQQPELKESFKDFKSQFEQDMDLQIEDEFEISNNAVKNQSRFFKSVIKLDKNFHVYIHGKREFVLKGYDEEKGMNYYQLFFNVEH